MDEKAHLPFLLKEHFLLNAKGNEFEYTPLQIEAPHLSLNSPFLEIKQSSDYPTFLKILYDFHNSPGCENLYVECSKIPMNIQSNIKTLIKIMHLIIPYSLIETVGNISTVNHQTFDQFLTEEQSYFFRLTIDHFQALHKSSKYYATDELKQKLFKRFLQFLTPIELSTKSDFPFLSQIKILNKNNLGFKKKDNIIMIYYDDTNVLLLCESDYQTQIKAKVQRVESNEKLILLNTGDPKNLLSVSLLNSEVFFDKVFIKNEIPIISNSSSFYPFSEVIINACQSINTNDIVNPIYLDCFAKMFLTQDCNFSSTLIKLINQEMKSLNDDTKKEADSISIIYSIYGKRLQLLKILSYIEIITYAKIPNEVFRHNENTPILTQIINNDLKDFYHTTISSIVSYAAKEQSFNSLKPTEEDAQKADNLLNGFWDVMFPSIDQIPFSVRSLFRYHRFLCEAVFVKKELNHRALAGFFLLRLIVSSFCSPVKIGMKKEDLSSEEWKKAVNFSKLLMSLSNFDCVRLADDLQPLVPVMKKHSVKMMEYFERLTDVDGSSEYIETQYGINDLADAVVTIKNFVVKNADKIRQNIKKEFQAPIFLFEAVSSFDSFNF